jgi:hypothetical protein
MEAVCSSETLVSTYNSTRRYNPEDQHRNFSPKDGGSMFLRNIDIYLQVHTAFKPKRSTSKLQSWRWRQYASPKHWYLPTTPHGVTTQKTNIETSVLKMEAVCSSETLISTYKSTQRLNPEDQHWNFNPEDGSSMLLRNIGIYLQLHTALQPRRPTSKLQSWRWRQYVPPKRWYLPTSPHGVSTQKTNIETSVLKLEAICSSERWSLPTSPHAVTTQKTNIYNL